MGGTDRSQFALLAQRRFLPYFFTQFLGAFNDNLFKFSLLIFIAFGSHETAVGTDVDVLTNLSQALFILPFFLFSATAGQLIEKHEKSRSIRRIKMMELVIMSVAAYGFFVADVWLLIALLFLMGLQSSLFGPAKYSYLPQHLTEAELLGANGLVQSGTFIAILLGTLCGGVLIAQEEGIRYVAVTVVVLAVLGYLSSLKIPVTEASDPDVRVQWNPLTETWRNIRFIREDGQIFIAILGVSWFWFIGATYLVQLPNYTRTDLYANEEVVTFLLILFTIGVGFGSLICDRLSDHQVNWSVVLTGSIGLTCFGVVLYMLPVEAVDVLMDLAAFIETDTSLWVMLVVIGIGASAGMYIVPLYTYVQQHTENARLSRIIAGNNIMNSLYMVVAAVLAMLMLGNDMSIPQLFLTVSVINLVVGVYTYKRLS